MIRQGLLSIATLYTIFTSVAFAQLTSADLNIITDVDARTDSLWIKSSGFFGDSPLTFDTKEESTFDEVTLTRTTKKYAFDSDLNIWKHSYTYDSTFDQSGRLVKEVQLWADTEHKRVTQLARNADGRLFQKLSVEGNSGDELQMFDFQVNYSYDAQGNVIQELYSRWDTISRGWIYINRYNYAFDSQNNKTEFYTETWNVDNAQWEFSDGEGWDYTYDQASNAEKMVYYWFDEARERTPIYQNVREYDIDNRCTTSYDYTDYGTSEGFVLEAKTTFEYDDFDNITQEITWRVLSEDEVEPSTYIHSKYNEFDQLQEQSYTYIDLAGDTSSHFVELYSYTMSGYINHYLKRKYEQSSRTHKITNEERRYFPIDLVEIQVPDAQTIAFVYNDYICADSSDFSTIICNGNTVDDAYVHAIDSNKIVVLLTKPVYETKGFTLESGNGIFTSDKRSVQFSTSSGSLTRIVTASESQTSRVYPTITSDYIFIENSNGIKSVNISDPVGKFVLTSSYSGTQNVQIDVSSLHIGIYMVTYIDSSRQKYGHMITVVE